MPQLFLQALRRMITSEIYQIFRSDTAYKRKTCEKEQSAYEANGFNRDSGF